MQKKILSIYKDFDIKMEDIKYNKDKDNFDVIIGKYNGKNVVLQEVKLDKEDTSICCFKQVILENADQIYYEDIELDNKKRITLRKDDIIIVKGDFTANDRREIDFSSSCQICNRERYAPKSYYEEMKGKNQKCYTVIMQNEEISLKKNI